MKDHAGFFGGKCFHGHISIGRKGRSVEAKEAKQNWEHVEYVKNFVSIAYKGGFFHASRLAIRGGFGKGPTGNESLQKKLFILFSGGKRRKAKNKLEFIPTIFHFLIIRRRKRAYAS